MKKVLFILIVILTTCLIACIKPHEHEFGEWVVIKEATEIEEGSKERICACGEKENQIISKLEHTHKFENGLCKCGEIHNCEYVDGKCTCGKEEPILITEIVLNGKSQIIEGEEITLTYEIKPDNASCKDIEWISSDDSIATVVDGKVKAIKEGLITIKALAKDGSNIDGRFTINVIKPLDYEKMSYSVDLNPTITIISSYKNIEGELEKTNRIILSLPYVNPNDGYVLSNVRCNSVLVKDTYEYEYLSELTYLEDLPYVSPRTHQFNSTKKGSKFDFDTLFTKLEYKVKYGKYEKDKILEFKTEILKLNDDDLTYLNTSNVINDFNNYPNYFDTLSEYCEFNETYDDKAYLNIQLVKPIFEKYKFDCQMYAIDEDGNIKPLIGYYNISSFNRYSYNRTTSLPFDKFKYIIVKGVLTYEENGETKELVLYKKRII